MGIATPPIPVIPILFLLFFDDNILYVIYLHPIDLVYVIPVDWVYVIPVDFSRFIPINVIHLHPIDVIHLHPIDVLHLHPIDVILLRLIIGCALDVALHVLVQLLSPKRKSAQHLLLLGDVLEISESE